MLTELHLGNFKAFAAPVRIPIRPLTLIFGPNSAGKSSLIHGLALGHEATRPNGQLDMRRTKLGGDAIDLGGFRQYVHRRALDQNVTWGVGTRDDRGEGFMTQVDGIPDFVMLASFGLPFVDEAHPFSRAKPTLASFQLAFGQDSRLRLSRGSDGYLRVDELTPSFAKILQKVRNPILSSSKKGQAWSENELKEASLRIFAKSAGLFPKIFDSPSDSIDLVDELQHVIAHAKYRVKEELKRLSYLGPLRSYPSRHMAFAEQDDTNWAAGGGRAWDRMRKSKKLRDMVNLWLGSSERLQTSYKILRRRFIAPSTAKGAIGAGVDEILSKLNERDESTDDSTHNEVSPQDRWGREEFVKLITRKLQNDRNADGDADLVLFDMRTKTTVSHRDVGIGISQVLPVLVEAYGNNDRLVAIEQPEIHLHPRLQAELADVFIESALGERNNTFLLETHSEHLILRVLRRIRETAEGRLPEGLSPVRPEDVAVLSVVPGDKGVQIVEIPVTAEGEFARPWPGGFFPERMKELY